MRKQRSEQTWNIKTITKIGMMIAVNIILTRFLAVNIGGFVRIHLGNVASMLTGLWFGPVAGAIAGAGADLVGLMLVPSGAWLPLITVSAAVWGIIPPFFLPLVKGSRRRMTLMLSLAVTVTSIVCQLGLTMAALLSVYGPGIVPGRLIQFACSTPVYCVLVCVLYFSIKEI